MEKKFYVYVHRRLSDGKIFYVGKGSGVRLSDKNGRSEKWKSIANKHGWTANIIARFSREECAFSFEIAFIAHIGRDKLANLTDGGDGVSGYSRSESDIKRLSEATKKAWLRSDFRTKIENIFSSHSFKERKSKSLRISQSRPEVRKKLSEDSLKQWENPETRKKMRISMSKSKGGRKFVNSSGVEFETHSDAISWLSENGFPKASQGNICMALNGKRGKAYGYEWKYCDATKV